ncbi:unnamed protein product [Allacma fusca]|uniref:SH2 domain-containing protein n=1 Tax=Allacma fusca TaxID=39272 RepID=A0A8J2P1F7_9HEXA|nr:unnamed protein product [Allacma fusca]
MLLWTKVRHLSPESVQAILNFYLQKHIPIEVRECLATWIENNFLRGDVVADPEEPELDDSIPQLCSEFFKEIDRTAQQSRDVVVQWKLKNASFDLQARFTPIELYQSMIDCLQEELRQLKQDTTSHVTKGSVFPMANFSEISQNLCLIMNIRNEYIARTQGLQSFRTDLLLLVEQRDKTRSDLDFMSQVFMANGEAYKQGLICKLNEYNMRIQNCTSMLYQHETFCLAVAEDLLNKLQALIYKLDQDFLQRIKWSGIDFDTTLSLDNLQQMCCEIFGIVEQVNEALRQSLMESAIPCVQYELDQYSKTRLQFLLDTLETLKYTLLVNSIVVDNQPPQLIKQSKAFSTKVLLLCGDKFTSQVSVKAVVLNEAQAVALYKNKDSKKYIGSGCGKIINSTGCKQCDNPSSRVVYQFTNVAISKMSRQEDSRAMREKFCLLFFAEGQIGSNVYPIWCCSVPFVYIVSNSQKPEGWGTIFWDNSFRELNRTPFAVPEKVSWSRMAVALNNCFKNMTKTQWNLTDTNLRCLGERIFQSTNFSDKSFISHNKFFEKDNVSPKGKWGWFYSCIDLTNRHLKPYWNDGYILGFINLRDSEEIILTMEPGTFLVRFSNGREGGVSMTVCRPINDGEPEMELENIMPLNNDDLKILSLPDRIQSYRYYTNVYHQKINKEHTLTSKLIAFKPFANHRKGSDNKYIPVESAYTYVELIMSAIHGASCLPGSTPTISRPSLDSGIESSVEAGADNSDDDDLMEMAAEIAGLGLYEVQTRGLSMENAHI